MSSQDDTSKGAASSPDGDKELDALLNSALQDFDKPPPAAPPKIVELGGGAAPTPDVANVVAGDEQLMDAKWTEEFIKQAAAQFEQNMQALMAQGGAAVGVPAAAAAGDGPLRPEDLADNFQKMAEAAAKALGDDNTGGDFSAAISQTLRNLSEGAENLQNPISEADLANMFGGMGMGDGGADGGDFLPFMQNMMQSLLSKEILYPALKDIVDKYPAWLADNAGSLAPDELERYTKQKQLMTAVCAALEQEAPTDSADTRNTRFNAILELMQQMQDCGQPPPDLVGDLGSVVSFDEQGNPRLPGLPGGLGADPANCSIM